jgi:hypothetical protein
MDQKRQNIAWNTSGQQIKLLQLRNTDQIAIIISIHRDKKPQVFNESHQQGRKRNPIDDKEGEKERKAESSLFIVQGAGFHQRLKYW